MKKTIFVCLSVIVGLIAFLFTFSAAVLEVQDGSRLVDVFLLSYLGVIVPNVALEITKFLCFKRNYKKIYVFDIISILMCLPAIIILNLIHLNLMHSDAMVFLAVWKREFFLYQFPWLIMFLAYSLLLIIKSKKTKQLK